MGGRGRRRWAPALCVVAAALVCALGGAWLAGGSSDATGKGGGAPRTGAAAAEAAVADAAPAARVTATRAAAARVAVGGDDAAPDADPAAKPGESAAAAPAMPVGETKVDEARGITTVSTEAGDVSYVSDSVLVRVRDGATADEVRASLAGVGGVDASTVTDADVAAGFAQVAVTDGATVGEAVEALGGADGPISDAQPDYVFEPLDDAARLDVNDPQALSQWALDSIGAREAWAVAKGTYPAGGGKRVTVAVLDDGFDISHPDLRNNIAAPWNADAGAKGDAGSMRGVTTKGTKTDHGTHVAGIVAAQAGNKVGVAGTSYNARVMPVRISDDAGNLTQSNIMRALDYVMRQREGYNIRVINMSFGCAGPTYDPLFRDKLAEAHAAGIVLVAAAGNKNTTAWYFPCDFDDVVGVVSLEQAGSSVRRASYSNYNERGGAEKTISAPGSSILSTLPDSKYGCLSGTSLAAPCVCGVLALEFSANPSLSADEAVRILHATARDLGARGFDEEYGYGEVDAAAAVRAAAGGGAPGLGLACVPGDSYKGGRLASMDVWVGGVRVAQGVRAWRTLAAAPGDKVELKNVTYDPCYEYDSVDCGPGLGSVSEGKGGSSFSFVMGKEDSSLAVVSKPKEFYLDLNWVRSGEQVNGNNNQATASVYVGGKSVASGVRDFCRKCPYKSSVKITVKPDAGYEVVGATSQNLSSTKVAGSAKSKTFTGVAGDAAMEVRFETRPVPLKLDFRPDDDKYGSDYASGARIQSFDAWVNGERVAEGVSDWSPKGLHVGDAVELKNISYRYGYEYAGGKLNKKATGFSAATDGSSISFSMPPSDATVSVSTKPSEYPLDLSWRRNGRDVDGENDQATASVWVGGKRVAQNVRDFSGAYAYGQSLKIVVAPAENRKVTDVKSEGVANPKATSSNGSMTLTGTVAGPVEARFVTSSPRLSVNFNPDGDRHGANYKSGARVRSLDLYVNGQLRESGVSDWYRYDLYEGDLVEMRNVVYRDGYQYAGCTPGKGLTDVKVGDGGSPVSFVVGAASSTFSIDTRLRDYSLDYNPDANAYGVNYARGARVRSLDAYVNGRLRASGVSDWFPTDLHAGDRVELCNVSYRDGYQYAGYKAGKGLTGVEAAAGGSSFSFVMGTANSTFSIDTQARIYCVDLNWVRDGEMTYVSNDQASADVWLDGKKVASGVDDYTDYVACGTPVKIVVTPKRGYAVDDVTWSKVDGAKKTVSGGTVTLEGTVGAGDVEAWFKTYTYRTLTYQSSDGHAYAVDAYVNGACVAKNYAGWKPTYLCAGDRIELRNVRYSGYYQYAGYKAGAGLTDVKVGADGSSFSFVMGDRDSTFSISTKARYFTIDLGWILDGKELPGENGQATANVYVGGRLVASGVRDFAGSYAGGTKFKIEVTPAAGCKVTEVTGTNVGGISTRVRTSGKGVGSGSIEGTMLGNVDVRFSMSTPAISLDYNPDANAYGVNYARGARVRSLDAYVNGRLRASGVSDWFPTDLHVGDRVELRNVRYRDGYEYAGNRAGAGLTDVKVGAGGSSFSFVMGTAKSTFSIDTKPLMVTLDLNWTREGRLRNSANDQATANVYVGGKLVASGVRDFCGQYPYGTAYRIDVFPSAGCEVIGAKSIQGILSYGSSGGRDVRFQTRAKRG